MKAQKIEKGPGKDQNIGKDQQRKKDQIWPFRTQSGNTDSRLFV